MFEEDVKFRKDITVSDNVSDHFYFDYQVPKYIADFFDVKYHPVRNQRYVLLSMIKLDQWYLNRTDALLDWANYSRWYLISQPLNRENAFYVKRFVKNAAIKDYPTQPTGHQKFTRYSEWFAENFTTDEGVVMDKVEPVEEGIVWSVYASISNYTVLYRYTNYTDRDADGNEYVIYDFKNIREVKLNLFNLMTIRCARNLAVTIYDYGYDVEDHKINREHLLLEIEEGRKRLLNKARRIRSACDDNFSSSVFIIKHERVS